MDVRDLGLMPYDQALALQLSIRDALQAGIGQPTVLIVEHPPVATLGRRGEPGDVFDPNLPVYRIDRGGKATYHGPGQIVVYPIVHLGEGNRDVRAWVRHLEALVIDTLRHFGIEAHVKPEHPGVWTTRTNKKIASIGVAIQGWVSTHGIALNATTPLSEFNRLDPCGLGASVMTNMQAEGSTATIAEVRTFLQKVVPTHFAAFAEIANR